MMVAEQRDRSGGGDLDVQRPGRDSGRPLSGGRGHRHDHQPQQQHARSRSCRSAIPRRKRRFSPEFSATSALPLGNCANAQAQSRPTSTSICCSIIRPRCSFPPHRPVSLDDSLTSYQDGGAGCAFACHQARPTTPIRRATLVRERQSPVYVGNDGQTPHSYYIARPQKAAHALMGRRRPR